MIIQWEFKFLTFQVSLVIQATCSGSMLWLHASLRRLPTCALCHCSSGSGIQKAAILWCACAVRRHFLTFPRRYWDLLHCGHWHLIIGNDNQTKKENCMKKATILRMDKQTNRLYI
ncbi:hypothetical protein HRR83_005926 [Exophiala dermatitidis]|uniref:Uncharacterized protein n=1 Tax=Exophiala dermatitidis TaxID=5970 RepID=A0AAN6EM20_EXODE|nr:hypothetical protein HRR74_008100 [Exophiala dermatitidis]KAJ4517349.1 hypothetical protein HRR73_004401 [Exophiala dermatitidis]KAJ4548905.1 hypothetical protein HRR76_001481 [Exophiala dermatitidis]KAJ4552375.1 hypothetical protein HRR77_002391 [Exophiala dermatitidis]KAJ4568328.1 hypothetical protein HRR79_004557 [Exophiala dermatitidis]